MKYTLTSDCIYNIIPYLNCIDIYNLKLVNKQSYRKIKWFHYESVIVRSLIDKLSFMNDQFIDILKHYKCIMYGSIIIQAIKNTNYDNSDIDIYVKKKYVNEIIEECLKIGFVKYQYVNGVSKYINHGISEIRYNNKKIQLIHGHEKFNINNSDINICKNAVYFNKNKIHVKISNINDIIHNKMIFDESNINYATNFLKRIFKYQNRGFKPIINKKLALKIIQFYLLYKIYTSDLKVKFDFDTKIYSLSLYFNFVESNHIIKCSDKCIINILGLNQYVQHYHYTKKQNPDDTPRIKQINDDWIPIQQKDKLGCYNVTNYIYINNIDNLFEESYFNRKYVKSIFKKVNDIENYFQTS